jgi:hypothetical protein
MLALATFQTRHFGAWHAQWHGGRESRVGHSPFADLPWENEGLIAAFDLDSGAVLWERPADTPAGFALTDTAAFVNSMYGNRILKFNTNFVLEETIASRWMSDLHSLVSDDRGLLLTSSGADAILEFTVDGKCTWSWFAEDHGYAQTPNHPGASRNDKDFRFNPIVTDAQLTHCNSAVRSSDGKSILATLFHQGQLIMIDRASGAPKVLVDGLAKPHSIRKVPGGGWILSDSGAHSVVLLDEGFWVTGIIEAGFDWVQDALALDEDAILIADANNSRLAIWSRSKQDILKEVRYSDEWKIYQVEPVNEAWSRRVASW